MGAKLLLCLTSCLTRTQHAVRRHNSEVAPSTSTLSVEYDFLCFLTRSLQLKRPQGGPFSIHATFHTRHKIDSSFIITNSISRVMPYTVHQIVILLSGFSIDVATKR